MLEAVAVLGKSIKSKKDSLIDYLSIAKLKKTKIILSIVIEHNRYVGIDTDEKKNDTDENKEYFFEKYLYSSGSANGPDRTPASLITEPEKTFNRKILRWVD